MNGVVILMELRIPTTDFPLHSFSKIRFSTLSKFPSNLIFLQRHRSRNAFSTLRHPFAAAVAAATVAAATLEQPGGKMVVELVGAFNELTERMNVVSSNSYTILFKSLKLSIPLLQALPLSPAGRSPLSKALSVALILADLQVLIASRKKTFLVFRLIYFVFGNSSFPFVPGGDFAVCRLGVGDVFKLLIQLYLHILHYSEVGVWKKEVTPQSFSSLILSWEI